MTQQQEALVMQGKCPDCGSGNVKSGDATWRPHENAVYIDENCDDCGAGWYRAFVEADPHFGSHDAR